MSNAINTTTTTTNAATTSVVEIAPAELERMSDGYSLHVVDGKPAVAVYKVGKEYAARTAAALSGEKVYKPRRIYIPADVDPAGKVWARAAQIAIRAYYAARIYAAQKALESGDAMRRADALDALLTASYAVTDGAAAEAWAASHADPYAEKIATAIAAGVCDAVVPVLPVWGDAGEESHAVITPGDGVTRFDATALATSLLSPSCTAKAAAHECGRLARWLSNGFQPGGLIPEPLKLAAQARDVERLRHALFAGLRAKSGAMRWTMATARAAAVQIGRFCALLIAENGAEYGRYIAAAEKTAAAEKAAKKGKKPGKSGKSTGKKPATKAEKPAAPAA